MELSYDFDVIHADAADAGAGYVALFRDPRAAEALRKADAEVRAWFEAAGFGYKTFDSGSGPGCYPEADEAARMQVIDRMSSGASRWLLRAADFNGFDFDAFLKAVVMARPVASPAAVSEDTAELAKATSMGKVGRFSAGAVLSGSIHTMGAIITPAPVSQRA